MLAWTGLDGDATRLAVEERPTAEHRPAEDNVVCFDFSQRVAHVDDDISAPFE